MPGNKHWSLNEQTKVIQNIISYDLLTISNPEQLKQTKEKVAEKLLLDPDFSARLTTKYPVNTVIEHLDVWINYLKNNGEKPYNKFKK